MAVKSLAVKYRPQTFDDVTEQNAVRDILTQQLSTDSIKNSYLFCGGAGTGKTTCARIFAKELNKGVGTPIEMDAASNNSVEDVRRIADQAKTKALDSEYKVFIIDECHALSNSAWQAMLKLIEEPPMKSIFIFCTTDPQKIPKTILSRVQRYDFQRISQQGIVDRLRDIISRELVENGGTASVEALEYIAKIADGGMRDAITLLDKCLAYNREVTIDNVTKAIGAVDYDVMIKLTDSIIEHKPSDMISQIEQIHMSGKDLKLFIKSYMGFILDVTKFDILRDFTYLQLPKTESIESWLKSFGVYEFEKGRELLDILIKLNADIKWDSAPKSLIEATLLGVCYDR